MKEGFEIDDLNYLNSRELVYVKGFNRFLDDRVDRSKLFKIKNYDFSNFKTEDTVYCFNIYPDDFFIELLLDLNPDFKLDKIIVFITKENFNEINLETHLPLLLKGSSIGYKIYKITINKYGWISSNKMSSNDAINLWFNLLQDDDLFCITSNFYSYAIDKKLNNSKLKDLLINIRDRNGVDIDDVYFDDDLLNKISELFESFDKFKNKI